MQAKLAAVEIEDTFLAEAGQFGGHGAAIHAEIIGQLLPVKGNGKSKAAGSSGPGGH